MIIFLLFLMLLLLGFFIDVFLSEWFLIYFFSAFLFFFPAILSCYRLGRRGRWGLLLGLISVKLMLSTLLELSRFFLHIFPLLPVNTLSISIAFFLVVVVLRVIFVIIIFIVIVVVRLMILIVYRSSFMSLLLSTTGASSVVATACPLLAIVSMPVRCV